MKNLNIEPDEGITIITCPHCSSDNITQDERKGGLICLDCGGIVNVS